MFTPGRHSRTFARRIADRFLRPADDDSRRERVMWGDIGTTGDIVAYESARGPEPDTGQLRPLPEMPSYELGSIYTAAPRHAAGTDSLPAGAGLTPAGYNSTLPQRSLRPANKGDSRLAGAEVPGPDDHGAGPGTASELEEWDDALFDGPLAWAHAWRHRDEPDRDSVQEFIGAGWLADPWWVRAAGRELAAA